MANCVLTVYDGSGDGTFPQDTRTEIVAYTPAPGSIFDHWTTFQCTADYPNSATTDVLLGFYPAATATAHYSLIDYTINYEAGTGGSISGNTNQTGLHYGETTTEVTAVADPGYSFVRWDDYNYNATRDDLVTANHTYTAIFSLDSDIKSVSRVVQLEIKSVSAVIIASITSVAGVGNGTG